MRFKLAIASLGMLLPVLVAPKTARAQDAGAVYPAAELTVLPKPLQPAKVAALVANSYPSAMREAGLGGSVQISFVVGTDGKVEKESVQVIAATVPALASAGKAVAERIEFKPGQKNGTPVRCRVVLPLVYRPDA